jgi:hypothetical protein
MRFGFVIIGKIKTIVRLEGSTLRVENGRPPAVSINLADPEGIWKLGNAIHEALRTTMLFASRL